ncbi:MAG: segregation/condensation protein A [Mariprofundaceae bacterium]|nr:segregation/condensation protein A [Mariprofundaceae bacterium]
MPITEDIVVGVKLSEQAAITDLQTMLPDLPPVQLDAFEGPLDILLHLIRKQKMDIFNIPIATITAQYSNIIDSDLSLNVDVAGEYLVMASTLMQLKSRLLLPRPELDEEGNDIDPRDVLVAQLLAYEQYRLLAEEINELPRMHRDIFKRAAFPESENIERPLPLADLEALLVAFGQVLKRMTKEVRHRVVLESMSVREQIQFVIASLQGGSMQFHDLLHELRGREAWVTTLLAILELWRQRIIQVVQSEHNAGITLLLCVHDDKVLI